jgi:hypothetical protein
VAQRLRLAGSGYRGSAPLEVREGLVWTSYHCAGAHAVCQARDIYFETSKNHNRTDLLFLGADDSRALSDGDMQVQAAE